MATEQTDDSSPSFVEQFESVDESRKKDAVIRRADEDLVSWLNRLRGQTWIDVNVGELSEAAGTALMDCMHLGAIEARFAAEAFIDPMGPRWQIEVWATGNRWRQRLPIEVEQKWTDGAKVQPDSIYRLRLTEYGDELHSDIQSRSGELGMILLHARLYHLIDPDVRITDKGSKQPTGHNGPSVVAAAQSSSSVVVNFHAGHESPVENREEPDNVTARNREVTLMGFRLSMKAVPRLTRIPGDMGTLLGTKRKKQKKFHSQQRPAIRSFTMLLWMPNQGARKPTYDS